MRQYVTTAIDYPNAAPHMGHVLEKVLADVVARWFRLCGDEVRFQIGTDEHGTKIQRTAEEAGITPKALIDRNVPLFEDLYKRLNISHDEFIQTSDQARHWPTVIELWKRLKKAKMLEKQNYTGLYCSGCERFMEEKDLVDGLCPDHKKAPEEVTEENWFFLLSKDTKWLIDLLKSKEYEIIPNNRRHETMSLLHEGLEDVSFSRPRSSLNWGVPVPDDEDQVMYVWCDALTNYISGLDYFNSNKDLGKTWWDNAKVTHVIGKDITRFHALIWPSMLKHAGVKVPDQLLVHGFLTSEGEKMSKSLGNVVKPDDVLSKFGGNPDPIRFYLSYIVPVGNDGDFSWKQFEELYDAKLRKQLGNALNRVLKLLVNKADGKLMFDYVDNWDMLKGMQSFECEAEFSKQWHSYSKAMNSFEIEKGTQVASKCIDFINAYIDKYKPWDQRDDPLWNDFINSTPQMQQINSDLWNLQLMNLAEMLRQVALMLTPIVPDTAYQMSKQLNVPYAEEILSDSLILKNTERDLTEWGSCRKDWKQIGKPSILFEPLS